MVIDLEAFPNFRDMVNPVSTNDAGSQLDWLVNTNATPSSNQTLLMFVVYDSLIEINAKGEMNAYT